MDDLQFELSDNHCAKYSTELIKMLSVNVFEISRAG